MNQLLMWLDKNGGGLAAIAAIAAAVATSILACFNYFLWKSTARLATETKRSINTAQATAEATLQNALALQAIERSYLLLTRILGTLNPDQFGNNESKIDFMFELKNYGRTPAVLSRAGYKIIESNTANISNAMNDLSLAPYEPIIVGAGDTLPPGFARTNYPRFISKQRAQQIIDAIRTNTTFVFALGKIEYKDVFGIPRTTLFCRQYNPVNQTFDRPGPIELNSFN